jgi:hypothetical protein
MDCSVGASGVHIGVSSFWRVVNMCLWHCSLYPGIKMAGKISDA